MTGAVVAAILDDLLGAETPDDDVARAAELAIAGGDPGRLVSVILASDTYLERCVEAGFVSALDRLPSRAEAERMRRAAAEGLRTCDVPLAVLEVAALETRRSFESFIAMAYDVCNGREVSVPEVAFWAGHQGTPRGELAKAIWCSPESIRRRIGEVFRTHLWQWPDGATLDWWEGRYLASGDEPLRIMLVGSGEYADLAVARPGRS